MNRLFLLALLASLILNIPFSEAKTIVCIAPPSNAPGDGTLNSMEGYERSRMKPGDVISTCQNPGKQCLQDCINQVQSGDELVIVAHGLSDGSGFVWGGDTIRHFQYGDEGLGNGDTLFLNTNLILAENVKLVLSSCFSGLGDPSVANKLGEMFGSLSGTTSYRETVFISACLKITAIPPTDPAYADFIALLAWWILEKGSFDWTRFPPPNRPGADPNQQTAAQNYINAFLAPNQVRVEVFYKPPYEATEPTGGSGILNGKSYKGSDLERLFTLSFLEWILQTLPVIPAVQAADLLVPPQGIYRSDYPLDFYVPELSEHLQFRNLRLDGFPSRFPLPDPGNEIISSNPITAFCDISNDRGHFFNTIELSGIADFRILRPETQWPGDTLAYVMAPLSITLQGASPFGDVLLFSGEPGTGVGVQVDQNGEWLAGATFSSVFQCSLNGLPSGSPGIPSSFTLQCEQPVPAGCTDPLALNYDPCALQSTEVCHYALSGCTYADALNFNPDASEDDGSCLFVPACNGDLDNDGLRNVGDLLILLSVYSLPCP